MSSRLADVFGIIESLKSDGAIVDYAVAGAMAVLFYAEPLRTYDLDVFIFLPDDAGTTVRVVRPEHLAALAEQTGGRKRREHVARLLETEGFDMTRFSEILERHGLADEWRKHWMAP